MARKSADSNGITVVLEVGQEAEGYYLNSTDKDRGPNLSRVHNFVNRDGEAFQIWGSAALDRIFCGDIGKELEKERPKVPQGAYVWIKRTEDLSESAKGVKFRQPMKNYTVDFDDEDWAEGYGPNAQGETAPAMRAASAQDDGSTTGEPAIPKSVAQTAEPKATEDEESDDLPW